MSAAPKLLIIEARFYDELADALAEGAIKTIEAAGATYERIAVPGVLEIPAALSMAMTAMENDGILYDGFVLLGVVIRGETTHYDYVCGESARGLMELTLGGLAVGNGILTVENRAQAMARAVDKNKGADAAEAALSLIHLRRTL